jgi:hypothetical protein
MHFAAYAYVAESTVDPLRYYDNNIGGTEEVFAVDRPAGGDVARPASLEANQNKNSHGVLARQANAA